MKRVRAHFDQSFKDRAVKLALSSSQASSQTAKELGVHPMTLYQWIKKYKLSLESPVDIDLHAENLLLRKENARLKEEREILKKAAIYFAQVTS